MNLFDAVPRVPSLLNQVLVGAGTTGDAPANSGTSYEKQQAGYIKKYVTGI